MIETNFRKAKMTKGLPRVWNQRPVVNGHIYVQEPWKVRQHCYKAHRVSLNQNKMQRFFQIKFFSASNKAQLNWTSYLFRLMAVNSHFCKGSFKYLFMGQKRMVSASSRNTRFATAKIRISCVQVVVWLFLNHDFVLNWGFRNMIKAKKCLLCFMIWVCFSRKRIRWLFSNTMSVRCEVY